jgi:hypothetical protein
MIQEPTEPTHMVGASKLIQIFLQDMCAKLEHMYTTKVRQIQIYSYVNPFHSFGFKIF